MRITFYIGTLQGGGAERVVANLANHLTKKGHDITILNTFENDSVYCLDKKIHLEYLISNAYKNSLLKKFVVYNFMNVLVKNRLKQYICSHKTECYVVLLEQPTICLLENKKYIDCPVIVSERNYPGIYPEKIKHKLFALASKADGYVFQTTQARQWYGKQLENVYAVTIPNAINEEFIDYKSNKTSIRNVIVNVGRLNAQKNQRLLLKSFSTILNEFPDINLEIYGQGPDEESLKSYAHDLGIAEKVLFKGFSKNIKVDIDDAKLFVLTSDFEGLPNSLIEAMALGLPCISTDFSGGGAREIIEDGTNGIIVDAGDENALVQAIKKVLDDNDYAQFLGENARKIRDKLCPQYIYDEWERTIYSVVEKCK